MLYNKNYTIKGINVHTSNVNIGFLQKPMLTYTLASIFVQKSMSMLIDTLTFWMD